MDADAHSRLAVALAGRYDITRELGRGGMATVYLARDLKHGRDVAIKVLNPDLASAVGAERFLSEIQVTARLQHPNILPLFDSGTVEDTLFYVMPFVDGESLRARLDREKQLPLTDAVNIGATIARALDYAHRHGVVHRDLKPENILLHEHQPLIADFGVALAISNAGGARLTTTGLSVGTPQYMSPEQASADRSIDGRSDIYSLATVTYEMLAGEPPHSGPTAQAVFARVLGEDPRAISAVRPSVPPHVEGALRCALSKAPADRFQTANEFADALTGSAHALIAARSRRNVTWKEAVAHPLVIAVIAIALIGAGASIVTQRRTSTGGTGGEVLVPILLPPAHGEFVNDNGTPFAISPDGRTYVYRAAAGGGHRGSIGGGLTTRAATRFAERTRRGIPLFPRTVTALRFPSAASSCV